MEPRFAETPVTGDEAAVFETERAGWLVCHTKPRAEKKFAALLIAEGLPYYLPLMESVRRYGNRTKRFTKPLFPGYVFAQVPGRHRARLYQQDLVARLIAVADETAFLKQLTDVRRIVEGGYELTVRPLLARGRRVRIVAGPLRGVEGLVDDASQPRGIVVAVDVLQQGLLIEVPSGDLYPLP